MNKVIIDGRVFFPGKKVNHINLPHSTHSLMRFVLKSTPVHNVPQGPEIDCVAWNEIADNIAANFSDGDEVTITGHLNCIPLESPNGPTLKFYEVVVSSVKPGLVDSVKETPLYKLLYNEVQCALETIGEEISEAEVHELIMEIVQDQNLNETIASVTYAYAEKYLSRREVEPDGDKG